MSIKNKEDDYNFKIEEFNEDDLFEAGLDSKQKEKIKKRMAMLLKELKESNRKFDIDITLEDILKIKTEMGKYGDEYEHGIKNSNVLKYITLNVIDKDIKQLKSEVIDELFVPSFISLPGVNTSYINNGASYFFKLYLTKDKLIYYGISERFKIVSRKVIDIKSIKSIGKSVKNTKLSKGLAWGVDTKSGYMSFIEFNNREIIYLNHLKSKYRKDVDRFLSNLEEVTGIKAVNKAPVTIEDKFTLIWQVLLFLFLVFLVIPALARLGMEIWH